MADKFLPPYGGSYKDAKKLKLDKAIGGDFMRKWPG